MDSLPDELLSKVLREISLKSGTSNHALVSRRWSKLAPAAQGKVFVSKSWEERRWSFVNGRIQVSPPQMHPHPFEAVVASISLFPSLTTLCFGFGVESSLNDEVLRLISHNLRQLKHLELKTNASDDTTGASYTSAGLRALCEGLPQLEVLALAKRAEPLGCPVAQDCAFGSRLCRLTLIVQGEEEEEEEEEGELEEEQALGSNGGSILRMPSKLSCLEALRVLHIHWSKARSVPDSVFDLHRLRILSFRCALLHSLPDSFARLERLTYFQLYSREIRDLPDSLWLLSRLEVLALRCNSVQQICPQVMELQNLKKLLLEMRNLRELPVEICLLPQIKRLTLHGTAKLSILPEEMEFMSQLTCLKLVSCNNLTSLPVEISRLVGLKSLVIRSCPALCDHLGDLQLLSGLSMLFISRCPGLRHEIDLLCLLPGLTEESKEQWEAEEDRLVWEAGGCWWLNS